jgi:hypothetical protein
MIKYNIWSLAGLILSTLAGIIFWLYLLSEMFTNVTGAPIIFVGLLILIAVVIGAAWISPGVAPLLLLFAGVMLSTYSATTSGRYDLFASLTLGLPFLFAASLILVGNKKLPKRTTKTPSLPDRNLP